MRLIKVLFIFLLTISCTTRTKNDKNVIKESDSLESKTGKEIVQIQRKILANGLITNIKGVWINTALFDSTFLKKQLSPWFNDFSGDLLLIIDEGDSVTINGNMDGGPGKIKIIDSLTFSFPDRIDNPTFKYTSQSDLIISLRSPTHSILFRRVNSSDRIEIIANEEKFDKFFIDKFFTSTGLKEQIVDISDGFESSAPYKFDAIGFKDSIGHVSYLAWKFNSDTLELYNTSFKDKDDYVDYKVEKLKEKLILKK